MSKPKISNQYKYGFESDVPSDQFLPGINEDVVRAISAKKKRARISLGVALKGIQTLANNESAKLG